MMVPQRHRDVGAKGFAQRFDQRRPGERAFDFLSGDEFHWSVLLRMILSENRFPSPIGVGDMLFGIMRRSDDDTQSRRSSPELALAWRRRPRPDGAASRFRRARPSARPLIGARAGASGSAAARPRCRR